MTINTDWFMRLIRDRYGSQRKFAKKMPMDQSNVSRMLSGERGMAVDEAQMLAELLEVSLIEVLENAGVKFDKPKRHGECPLCGRK